MTSTYPEIEMGPIGAGLPHGRVQSVDATSEGLVTRFADRTATFNYDWLRDNCQCDECRIRQTDERRWQPWSETSRAQLTTAEVDDGALRLQWATGHTSVFNEQTWTDLDRSSRRGGYAARLWSAGYEI